MLRFLYTAMVVLFSVAIISAQVNTCQEELESIIETVGNSCADLERNHVCYGNWRIDSEIADDSLAFSEVGNMLNIVDLISLRTFPLSLEDSQWGIALFNIQANIPNTIPGQSVTLVVYGNTELEQDRSALADYREPMRAFTFSTGIGNSSCQSFPESGILIQSSPDTTVNLLINGYEIELSSTVFFTATERDELSITTLEGLARVQVDGIEIIIPEGFSINLTPNSVPNLPSEEGELEVPLVDLLPEPVPQIGEPSGQYFSLLECANGGIAVESGASFALRGGWATYELDSLLDVIINSPPSLSFDGQELAYSYRTGPFRHELTDGEGVAVYWFWLINDIASGTHEAMWHVGGSSVVCEIRAD